MQNGHWLVMTACWNGSLKLCFSPIWTLKDKELCPTKEQGWPLDKIYLHAWMSRDGGGKGPAVPVTRPSLSNAFSEPATNRPATTASSTLCCAGQVASACNHFSLLCISSLRTVQIPTFWRMKALLWGFVSVSIEETCKRTCHKCCAHISFGPIQVEQHHFA